MNYMVAKVYFDSNTENSYEKFHLLNLKFAELGCKIVAIPNIEQDMLNNIVSIEKYMSTSDRERCVQFMSNAKVCGVFKVLLPMDRADEYIEWSKYQKFRNPAKYVQESEATIRKVLNDTEDLLKDVYGDA